MSDASTDGVDNVSATAAADPLVDLVIEAPGWAEAQPSLAEIANRAAMLALEAAGLPPDDFSVVLLACNDARIAELNGAFRGQPVPTNVLSWPGFPIAPPEPGKPPPHPPIDRMAGHRQPLGDIAIALETVLREAGEQDRPLKNHATHLILHACLHLVGYDHETAPDAALMEGLERQALARAGIPDPYDEEARSESAL